MPILLCLTVREPKMAGLSCLAFRYQSQRAWGAEKGSERSWSPSLTLWKMSMDWFSRADSQFPVCQCGKIRIRTEAMSKTRWCFPQLGAASCSLAGLLPCTTHVELVRKTFILGQARGNISWFVMLKFVQSEAETLGTLNNWCWRCTVNMKGTTPAVQYCWANKSERGRFCLKHSCKSFGQQSGGD